MKPWLQNGKWFERYARGLLALKCPGAPTRQTVVKVRKAMEGAFTRVYRCVAFDIDGTLTLGHGIAIDGEMARVIGRLLQRGVPVILITGRGRASTRRAAQDIRRHSGLSDWYVRRLQCITHNGVFLLRTPTDTPAAFLSTEEVIGPSPEPQRVQDLFENVKRVIERCGLGLANVDVTKEPHSIRIALPSAKDRARLEEAIRDLALGFNQDGSRIYLSRGAYGTLNCLDLSWTNKKRALEHVAALMGVDATRILRIGDQGQKGGNDFDLLDSPSGFSVGEFSSNPVCCHPVLAPDMRRPLAGSEATNRLLELALLFPSLSIAAAPIEQRLSALRNFEKLAINRSRQETEHITQQLRVRLRYMLPESFGFGDPHTLRISDIYDQLSGGVKFRDWELDDLPPEDLALRLFEVPKPHRDRREPARSGWSMYTDTGILMRGPNYYFGLTRKATDRTLSEYVKLSTKFIEGSMEVLDSMVQQDPDLTRFKLVLAIQDNVRNILLHLLHAAFTIEGKMRNPRFRLTRKLHGQAVSAHTKQHFRFLLNPDADWQTSLSRYRELLRNLQRLIDMFWKSVASLIRGATGIEELFKWRECDHFLQNLGAIQLGLHELRQRPEVRKLDRLMAVGLSYGGIELPSIAEAVSSARGYGIRCALAKVSIYHKRAIGRQIRAGNYDYVTGLLLRTKPLCIMEEKDQVVKDAPIVLMDDNCTTCVTLQLARDFLVLLGGDVVGAVVVRFPGVNRHVQMAMPGHGFPDPEVLFGFIRGLIAPSPYTRLVLAATGKNPYLDETGVFDKARQRIKRYLLKNGTPAARGR